MVAGWAPMGCRMASTSGCTRSRAETCNLHPSLLHLVHHPDVNAVTTFAGINLLPPRFGLLSKGVRGADGAWRRPCGEALMAAASAHGGVPPHEHGPVCVGTCDGCWIRLGGWRAVLESAPVGGLGEWLRWECDNVHGGRVRDSGESCTWWSGLHPRLGGSGPPCASNHPPCQTSVHQRPLHETGGARRAPPAELPQKDCRWYLANKTPIWIWSTQLCNLLHQRRFVCVFVAPTARS